MSDIGRISRNSTRMTNKIKILIVEDEFISRTLLKEMLSPFGECDVVTNGVEAISALEQSYSATGSRYDLVCLDIMMPKLSGHEVLREMRRIEKDTGIHGSDFTKVIMVTALDDAKNIMAAMVDGGCAAYLTKPISRTSLFEQLHHLQLIDDIEQVHSANKTG